MRVRGTTESGEGEGSGGDAYRLSEKGSRRSEVESSVTQFGFDSELTPDLDDEVGGVFVEDLKGWQREKAGRVSDEDGEKGEEGYAPARARPTAPAGPSDPADTPPQRSAARLPRYRDT